jgi:hypothetical protein
MKWITRERVKVDRVACPWLIKKFVDTDAEFLFVPTDEVMAVAERESAVPYDVKDVELSASRTTTRSMPRSGLSTTRCTPIAGK